MAMEIIERIIGSEQHLCTVGMQVHSTSIKWIQGGTPKDFILIDPLDREGLKFLNMDEVISYIKNGIRGKNSGNNFFAFID